MRVVRQTRTLCPDCGRELEGRIVVDEGKAWLERDCPEHGRYRFPLSNHGDLYADLDRFYFDVLKGHTPQGRITNYWLLVTPRCQMHCRYCSVGVDRPSFDDMSVEDFRAIIKEYGHVKLTLSGGEPTQHPHMLDFFREATAAGVLTQLATNGVELASMEYCRRLIEVGVTEVRLSVESLDVAQAEALGLAHFREAKLEALENLRRLNLTTSLSPTIFQGINDEQLVACIEYAKDKPFLRSVPVNGFSWVGSGHTMARENMIQPDQMMDLLFARYFTGDREAIFTFEKALLALMQLAGIRLCMYTQIMIFVRGKRGLAPITDFLNMKRLKRGMAWWERFARSRRATQMAALALVLLRSMTLKSFRLVPAALDLLLANWFQIRISKYPSRLLPVTLNTNCSPLSADEAVGIQCMSGCLVRSDGTMGCTVSTQFLLDNDRRQRPSARD